MSESTGPSQSGPPASRLIPIRPGESTGNRELAIQATPDPPVSRQGPPHARPDAGARGEGASAFEAGVASALEHLFEAHSQGDAIVVTHGGVIQIALHSVVGRPSHGLFPFRISNGSASIVERRNGRIVIDTVNDTSHLEGLHEE